MSAQPAVRASTAMESNGAQTSTPPPMATTMPKKICQPRLGISGSEIAAIITVSQRNSQLIPIHIASNRIDSSVLLKQKYPSTSDRMPLMNARMRRPASAWSPNAEIS